MAENWERADEIIRTAIVKVYEPAMRRHFADRFEEVYGADWFDRTNQNKHHVSQAIGVELSSRLESDWWNAIGTDQYACEWPTRPGELA